QTAAATKVGIRGILKSALTLHRSILSCANSDGDHSRGQRRRYAQPVFYPFAATTSPPRSPSLAKHIATARPEPPELHRPRKCPQSGNIPRIASEWCT